jgi:MYXO-CTERM domain-containing protein
MLRARSPRLGSLPTLSALALLALSTGGCTEAPAPSESTNEPAGDEPLGVTSEAISSSDVITCAEEWVADQVPYCGGVNGGTDYICGGTCSRPSAAWDNYRSDCSGFVSWCWKIASDPTTSSYMVDKSGANGWHTIALADLQAGDALVCDGHIKIFSQLVSATKAEVYEESNCGKVAHKSVESFTKSGETVKFQYDSRVYHAIRRNGILPPVNVDGYLDSASDVVKGWAADLDASATPLQVDLYFGGGPSDGFGVSVTADEARPDVAAALGIDPNHGFSTPTPLYYCDDQDHPVEAFAHAVAGGVVPLKQSPGVVHCPVPSAPAGLLRHVTSPDVLGAWSFDERKSMAWMTPADRDAHAKSADWPAAPVLGSTSDGRVWVVDGAVRRHVKDPTSLAAWGFDPAKIVAWSDADAAQYVEGIELPEAPVLLEAVGDPAVWVLDTDPSHLSDPPTGAPGSSGSAGGASGASGANGNAAEDGDGSARSGGCSIATNERGDASTGRWLAAVGVAVVVARRRRREETSPASPFSSRRSPEAHASMSVPSTVIGTQGVTPNRQ